MIHSHKATKLDESVVIQDGETVEQFIKSLCDALDTSFAFDTSEPDEEQGETYWYVDQVAGDTVRVMVGIKDSTEAPSYYQIPYGRNPDGSFAFGDPEEVERVTTWVPVAQAPVEAAPPKVKQLTRPWTRKAKKEACECEAKPKQESRRRAPDPVKEIFRERANVKVSRLPDQEGFLRVFEAKSAIAGVVNRNGRLYAPAQMKLNAERWAREIQAGMFIAGEANHPEGAPDLLACCTQMLGARFEEASGTLICEFGLLPTQAGRDIEIQMDRGRRIGTSTRALGYSETRTMCEQDPYWDRNQPHAGKAYEFVYEFELEAVDLVSDPSAGTYIGESRECIECEAFSEQSKSFAHTLNRATPITPTNAGPTGGKNEETMNKDDLKKALEALSPDELEAMCPELCGRIVAKAMEAVNAAANATKQAQEANEAKSAAAIQALESKLADQGTQITELKAGSAATSEIAKELKSERDEARGRAARIEAVTKAVQDRQKDAGYKLGKALESYLREHFVEGSADLAKVPEAVARFDRDYGAFMNEQAGGTVETAPAGAAKEGNFLDGVMFQ